MSPVTPEATPRPRGLSIGRRVAFACVAVALFCVFAGVALLAVDLYLHARFHERGGYNRWGYRGVVLGSKRPHEVRLAFLGGSTAFGYGVSWRETIPIYLERDLRARLPGREVSVANLGFPNDGAFAMRFTLEDYRYLHADIVCLYEGYNDLMGDPDAPYINVFRRGSPVFRLTGYLPIFPVVFREKASALLYGDTNGIYLRARGEATTTAFKPNVASRASAEALTAAASISESLERQLGKLSKAPPTHVDPPEPNGCAQPWTHYCRGIFDAVDYALAEHQHVIVISQPYLLGEGLARHQWQQGEMRAALARRYRSEPRVRYVDAGPSVDIADRRFGYDGMHLTADGNRRVAAVLVEPVLAVAASVP